MKRHFLLSCVAAIFWLASPAVPAQAAQAPAAVETTPAADAPPAAAASSPDTNTMAVAAVASRATEKTARPPDFLEHLVDAVLGLFNVRTSGNTATHYVISAVFLVGAFLLRRIVTVIIFAQLRKIAAKTETTLDDKLFPAMEAPVATFIMVTGIFSALKVLKLTEESDRYIAYGSTIAFSLVIFWGLLRAFDAVLEHAHEVAVKRQMSVAAFMPWIKKTLVVIFVVIGGLMVIQSLGYAENVKTVLAGLGIGGLAFALAAQDTLANLFGSIVVAIDQPFKIGETVKIGANTGTVEDIGLRSTKIRLVDKSLMVIPNKTVAAEAITNLARFTQRRVEQVINLTYDTTPEQMEAIVAEIRQLILREPQVDASSVLVFFRDLSASSLDIWIVYVTKGADFKESMTLRQRINLDIMRAVAARGLIFAFPTSVMHLDGPIAKQLAERKT